MTEQELRKLRRVDLLEILLDISKENDVLRTQLDKARAQLTSRTIAIEKSGSLAEAALRVNGVFEAAQAACEQYTLNLQQRSEQQEQICQEMERKTQEKCEQLLQEAQREAKSCLNEARGLLDSCIAKARVEADEICAEARREAAMIRAEAKRDAESIRAEATAYRDEAEKAVKDMVDSYSWLTKVLN